MGMETLKRGKGRDGGAMRETGRQAWTRTGGRGWERLLTQLSSTSGNDLPEPQDPLIP